MERIATWAASARSGVREFFLLPSALERARSRSPAVQRSVRELVRAADRRRAAARTQSLPDQLPAGLVLLREAFILTAQAWQTQRDSAATPSADSAAAHTDAIPSPAELRALARTMADQAGARPPSSWDAVVNAVADDRPLAYDAAPLPELRQLQSDTEDALEWMRRLVDGRSVQELQVSRALRIGTLALGLLAVLIWVGFKMRRPDENLALNRPVQASSRRPYCPPESGPAGLGPEGLVDGRTSSAYDVCTNGEVNPWVMVDLGASQPVSNVKVYSRSDCCWGAYDLPQVLEVSNDGAAFEVIARQAAAYSAVAPWKVDLAGKSARYVRVRVESPEVRELVLTELEVFRAR